MPRRGNEIIKVLLLSAAGCTAALGADTGRVIDLGEPQGRIGFEQAAQLVIEDARPEGGWSGGGKAPAPDGLADRWPGGVGHFGSADDQIANTAFEDPSEAPPPPAKSGAAESNQPEGDLAGEAGEFEPGDGGEFKGLGDN